MLASAGVTFLAERLSWSWLTEGFRIIILTVVISLAAALLFPLKEEAVEGEVTVDGE